MDFYSRAVVCIGLNKRSPATTLPQLLVQTEPVDVCPKDDAPSSRPSAGVAVRVLLSHRVASSGCVEARDSVRLRIAAIHAESNVTRVSTYVQGRGRL